MNDARGWVVIVGRSASIALKMVCEKYAPPYSLMQILRGCRLVSAETATNNGPQRVAP